MFYIFMKNIATGNAEHRVIPIIILYLIERISMNAPRNYTMNGTLKELEIPVKPLSGVVIVMKTYSENGEVILIVNGRSNI